MKRIKLKTLMISFAAVLAVCICASVLIANSSVNHNTSRRVFEELETSTSTQAAYLEHSVGQQFDSLEALANYLGVCDDAYTAFTGNADLTGAIVLANDLCMLGYADIEGNAVGYTGEDLGNISDRAYFKSAVAWKDSRAVEYMESAALTGDPRVLFGVPIVKNNVIVGIVFASKETDTFESALFSGSFGGSELFVITDPSGNIIAVTPGSSWRFGSGSIFDEYTTENISGGSSVELILENMRKSSSGTFSVMQGGQEYVSYTPLGINDWYLFGIVRSEAVKASFSDNAQGIVTSISLVCVIFAIAVVYIAAALGVYARQVRRDRELARQKYEHYNNVLGEMRSAVYSFDIATQALTVSDALEDILGYDLPDGWAKALTDRRPEHPEFDYDRLAKAKSDVELTGRAAQVTLRIHTVDQGMRWIRITLSPQYTEEKVLESIYGVITDVTEDKNGQDRMQLESNRALLALNALAPLVISANLSQNRFRMMNYEHFTTKAAPETGVFDELIEIGASTVPEADRQSFVDAFSRVSLLAAFARGEKRVELEHRQVGDDGVTRWIRTMVLFVDNPYDDEVYEVTLARDISDSKAYQALLQKTYDMTIENMPCYVGKWVFTDDDVLLANANQKYLDFMGIDDTAAFHRSIIYGFSEAEKRPLIRMLLDSARERKPVSFISRACKATGEECWLKVMASYLGEENGCTVYYGTLTDVTELVKTQERLRISRREYEVAAALSGSAVLTYDIARKSYATISLGQSPLDFSKASSDVPEAAIRNGYVAPESIDTIRRAFNTIESGENGNNVILALTTRKGTRHWTSMSWSIIRDDGGAPVTAIISFSDVTDKKQAETMLNISDTFLRYSKNVFKFMAINLSRRTVEYESEGPHGILVKSSGSTDIQIVRKYTIDHTVVPEDAESCMDFFSIDRFLAAFRAGNDAESFEYRGLVGGGAVHWLNVQTRTIRDSITTDLMLYIVFTDINEQKLAELELLREPQTDDLTGLIDRAGFEKEIKIRCSDPQNRGCGLYNAIVMLDLDGFEGINDTYGRAVGDNALRETARRIRRCLNPDDVAARFGGDEFIMLFPGVPSQQLIEQRCSQLLGELDFMLTGEIHITASMGIAICPEDGSDFDTLLKKADGALYQAKLLGGSQCARYNENGAQHFLIKAEPPEESRVFARTFGYFDLFVNGSPLHFSSAKEKELLAVLIDRNGGTLTSSEAISILWEDELADERTLARYRKLAMNLRNTLQNAGADFILVTNRGVRNIDTMKLECDYYQFLNGDQKFRKLYSGVYMANYSWAEATTASLDNMT